MCISESLGCRLRLFFDGRAYRGFCYYIIPFFVTF
jgi:hypothetical protein